jgi:hypothetical protein
MSSLKGRKSSRTEEEPAVGPAAAEVTIGTVCGVDGSGAPVVQYAGNPAGAPVRAEATAAYDAAAIGREVALLFLGGDPARPLAIGLVRLRPEAPAAIASEQEEESLVLTARREITLRCGQASITLTRAGKVLVRGAYVSLRSSGMQRITGASVQIN